MENKNKELYDCNSCGMKGFYPEHYYCLAENVSNELDVKKIVFATCFVCNSLNIVKSEKKG